MFGNADEPLHILASATWQLLLIGVDVEHLLHGGLLLMRSLRSAAAPLLHLWRKLEGGF